LFAFLDASHRVRFVGVAEFGCAPPPGLEADASSGKLTVMDTPPAHWVEIVTGLCAAGCQVVLGFSQTSKQGHPMIPVVEVTSVDAGATSTFAGCV
jgi:hypothetical protein